MAEHAPTLDLEVLSSDGRIEPYDEVWMREALEFRTNWEYIDGGREGMWLPVSDLRLCSCHVSSDAPLSEMKLCTHKIRGRPCIACMPGQGRLFWRRISSQLLLYRITLTFGMPPAVAWHRHSVGYMVVLKHTDGGIIELLRSQRCC